jgi:tetratricopeptide (TPR) repeat protein
MTKRRNGENMRRITSLFSSRVSSQVIAGATEIASLHGRHAGSPPTDIETIESLGMMPLKAALLRGKKLRKIALHLSNQSFDQALKAANSHLASYPNDGFAWGLMAQAYIGKGQDKSAADALQRSIDFDRENIYLKRHVGLAEASVAEYEKAISILEEVLNHIGDDAVVLALMRSYRETGRWKCATELSQRITEATNDTDERILSKVTSNELEDIYSLSVSRIGNTNEMYYRSADMLWREDVERAVTLLQQDSANQAMLLLKDIIGRDDRYIDPYFILGNAFFTMRDIEQAKTAFSQGLSLGENFPRQQRRVLIERVSDAARNYIISDVLYQQTDGLATYVWLADHYSLMHDWERAEHYFTKALEIEPNDRRLKIKLVRVLANLGKDIEALQLANKLAAQHPKDSAVHRARGDIQMAFSQYKDAAASYKLAADRNPSNPFYRARLAQAYFIDGKVRRSLALNEHRKEVPSFIAANKAYPFPEWNGQLFSGKRLLVWHEHGFGVGQNILHSCFLNLVSELGIDLVLEVEQRLVPLYQRSFPQIEVVAGEHASYLDRTDIGYQTPIGSLARWFRTSIESFADHRPFFRPDVDRSSTARASLLSETRARHLVGISWTSTNPYVGDKKSIDLVALLSALDLPDVQLVNLQYGDHENAIRNAVAQTGVSLIPSGVDNTNDLDGLAAVTDALDLVISIGHTTAHLAGAIGKRNLVLLPSSPFVHWLATGSECIWYANSTLIRRAPADLDWSIALAETRRLAVEFLATSDGEPGPRESRGGYSLPSSEADVSSFAMQNAIGGFSAQNAFGSAIELLQRKSAAYGWTRDDKLQMTDLLTIAGRRAQASKMLSELAAAEPQSADIVQRQYRLALAKYQLEDALRHSSALVELCEDTYELMLERITLLHKLGRTAEALDTSRSLSLVRGPSPKWALIHSRLLNEVGLTEQAEATLAPFRTMAVQPEIETALAIYAYEQGKVLEGLNLLDRAAAAQGAKSAVARFWRAKTKIGIQTEKSFHIPNIIGTFPSCSKKDNVVFFAADNIYFWNYCRALIASIAINSHQAYIHVHVINPDELVENAIDTFRENFKNISISYTYEVIDVSKMTSDMLKTYFACARFIRLPELMKISPATYLCIDCDCIVRGPLSKLDVGASESDIIVHRRFVTEEFLEVAAGGLVIMPTPAARQFLERLYSTITGTIEAGEASWFLDQIALNQTISTELKVGLKISQLDISYIDWFFNSDSIIWTGKGERKNDNLIYLTEFDKYFNYAIEL